MQVRIPYSQWFECSMYLNQNYIMPIANYTLVSALGHYTINFYHHEHYDMFVRRFGTGICAS